MLYMTTDPLDNYTPDPFTDAVPAAMVGHARRMAECLDTFEWPERAMAGDAFTLRETPDGGVDLLMEIWVRNNETPDDEDLYPLTVSTALDSRPPAEQILGLIVDFYRHETREQLIFNGTAALYPHDEHPG